MRPVICCAPLFPPRSIEDSVKRSSAPAAELLLPKSAPVHVGDLWDRLLITAIFAGIVGLVWFAFRSSLFDPMLAMARRGDWGGLMLRPAALWLAMGFTLLVMRTLLWIRYSPAAPAGDDEAPMLSVLIPAYNEGAMVEKSIESAAAADYPRDRLEIIVIDDGSRDDTWSYIQRAAVRHAGLVEPIRLAQNRGKRGALAEGFRRACGEIFVTMDSDSVIDRGALRAMAGPLRDPRVGAVAGKVLALNRRAGLLPRMLHVRFVLAFDFLRSAQSVFRTVYCCPGALAAYRAPAVREVLERWERQRFLGVACTYGEDRALTNYLFDAGYDAVYQRLAVVHTLVPETYVRLCKMFLRWDRSFIREEIRFSRIVWKRPLGYRLAALFETTVTNLRYPVGYLSIGLWIAYLLVDPGTVVRMLAAIGVVSTVYTLYYLRSERSWDFLYGVLYAYFSFFALTWIFPYAALSLRARGWLTR
jgi:hyaluronan synthase